MAYPNQNSLAQQANYMAPDTACVESMATTLNCLNEFAKAARQRSREIEARLLGQGQTSGISMDQTKNTPQPVQSVADVITETRAIIGQTIDTLDRIQAQL